MPKLTIAPKRVLISKANASMVIVIAAAAFVTVFSFVASNALLSQRNYQSRVIADKEKAKKQLTSNLQSVDALKNSYQAFVGTQVNVIGGSPTGQGDKDGDNAKIVLDALPSKYDYPALATSVEKILGDRGLKIESISGIDDEIAQQKNSSSTKPQPIEMPFKVTVSGSYKSIQDLISELEHSIRPFKITSMSFAGSDADMRIDISASTYYQPEKSLNINTKVVK